jgi:NAD(P)-dependent dehydrogenase (short-subunit alcohol dehydrogenase family)
MADSGWTAADLPDLTGRTFVVTGGNSGIGFEAARGLAGARANVVLACRSLEKAGAAVDVIRGEHAAADVEAMALDLASLASVREFAKTFLDRYDALHALVNNAGVMAIPRRETTDGFEMQLGTNHLGHFALTGLLFDRLAESGSARIVNVSSTAHRGGSMHFDDLQLERGYGKWKSYGQSKLANLLFTYELSRRAKAKDLPVVVAAAHPGYAATNLQAVGPKMEGSGFMESVMQVMNRVFSQSAEMGALPTLYAAAAQEVCSGDYIGPNAFFETWGHPKKVDSSGTSKNAEDARRLWEISEQLTGVRFGAL